MLGLSSGGWPPSTRDDRRDRFGALAAVMSAEAAPVLAPKQPSGSCAVSPS